MEGAGANCKWQTIAGLDAHRCREAGDVLVAGQGEMGDRFVAHVFDDVERDGGEGVAIALREKILGADAERGGAVGDRVFDWDPAVCPGR